MTKSKAGKGAVPIVKGAKVVFLDGKAIGEIKYDRKYKSWAATSYFAEMGADCIDSESDAKEYVVDDYWEWVRAQAARLSASIVLIDSDPEILDSLNPDKLATLIRVIGTRYTHILPVKTPLKGGKK